MRASLRLAIALAVLSSACVAASNPDWPELHGDPSDPSFCVNVEADGRKYTANNGPPTKAQAAAGVEPGRYPYPTRCVSP